MTTIVSKWGNSLAIRIPSDIIQKSNLCIGDKLDMTVSQHGKIILAAQPKDINFWELYEQITPQNRYNEELIHSEVGNEKVVW